MLPCSFRRLALEFHPDKNSSKTAEGKFGAVCEAYTVLSNRELAGAHLF